MKILSLGLAVALVIAAGCKSEPSAGPPQPQVANDAPAALPDDQTALPPSQRAPAVAAPAASPSLLPRIGYLGYVYSVAFSPDGETVATATDANRVVLWDAATLLPSRTLTGHGAGVFGVAFSRDGALLASASDDGSVILWDVATGVQHGTMYSWGKEWVVTTPAGDFACSDGAMKDLSWVADGKRLPADAFAAEHRKQAVRLAP